MKEGRVWERFDSSHCTSTFKNTVLEVNRKLEVNAKLFVSNLSIWIVLLRRFT